MSHMGTKMIKKLNKEREKEIEEEMKEEYKYQCWIESIEYYELMSGR